MSSELVATVPLHCYCQGFSGLSVDLAGHNSLLSVDFSGNGIQSLDEFFIAGFGEAHTTSQISTELNQNVIDKPSS